MSHSSELITNVPMAAEDVAATGAKLLPGQKARACIFKVSRASDWFFCCLAGGDVHTQRVVNGPAPHLRQAQGDFDVSLTPTGNATVNAAMRLLGTDNVMVLYGINCCISNDELRRRVQKAIELAPAQGLLVFVGDIAGKCDGRIMPILNIVGTTTVVVVR